MGYDDHKSIDAAPVRGVTATARSSPPHSFRSEGTRRLSDKPRILVIARGSPRGSAADASSESAPSANGLASIWGEAAETVRVSSIARAIHLLGMQDFAGVFVERSQLPLVRDAGQLLQAEEILEVIADGVALLDNQYRITWRNAAFDNLAAPGPAMLGRGFAEMFAGSVELVDLEALPSADRGDAATPVTEFLDRAQRERKSVEVLLKVSTPPPHTPPHEATPDAPPSSNSPGSDPAVRYLKVAATPVWDPAPPHNLLHLVLLVRDVTAEVLERLKLDAIHHAGEELADILPQDLSTMTVEDRKDLLKHNIGRHMKTLLGLDYFEIRLLDKSTQRLIPLLAEGMTEDAASRALLARVEGSGVTGYVAATAKSYLCPDTAHDPLYLPGAEGARSSLTVPLIDHGQVIGTLNVENSQPHAFDDRDRRILEIYARSVASALHTLELLEAEKATTVQESVETIRRQLALPIDQILADGMRILDRYAGHDDEILQRLRRLIATARRIARMLEDVGSTLAPTSLTSGDPQTAGASKRFAGRTILVADAQDTIRVRVHEILGQLGAVVETVADGQTAVAQARHSPYSLALVDIRLPDMKAYDVFRRLREVQPDLPVIFITGFGYDPSHAIVKARQEGLKYVLFKPFKPDKLIELVELALRDRDANGDSSAPSLSPQHPSGNSPDDPHANPPRTTTVV